MSEGKSLKFQFVLDEHSFQRVKRALGELTTDAAKFAKAMQGAANVGRPPSAVGTQGRGGNKSPGIAGAILGDVEAFTKLAKSGKTGMAAMTDAVRTGVRDQMREIEKLEGKLARLQDRFNKDPRAAYEGAFRTKLQGHMLTQQGLLSNARGTLTSLQAAQAGLAPTFANAGFPPGGGGGAVGAAGGAAGAGGLGNAMSMAQMAQMAARIAGMAMAGGAAILNTSISADKFGLTQEAMRGRAMQPMMNRVRRGDISDMMALRSLSERSGQEQMEILRSSIGMDANAKSRLGGLGGFVNFLSGGGTAGDANQLAETLFGDSVQTTDAIAARQAILDQVKQSPEFLSRQRYLDYVDESRGDRMQSSRIAGIGMYRTKEGLPDERRLRTLREHTAQSLRMGLDESSRMAAWAESRNQIGGFAMGDSFALNNASGFGAFNSVMTAAARLGNPSLANLALGGGINNAAGIQLGQGVLGQGFDPRGTTSGYGALSAFQGGYGGLMGDNPAMHFNLVQQALAGLATGNGIVGGTSSGWQQGMNVLGAVRNNPGGDAYTTDYLATGMTFKQMLDGARGSLTETAIASNITPEMLKAQLGSAAEGSLSLWKDTGADDPRSRAMRRYKASGMGVNAFMASATDADAMGMAAQLGMMNPTFGEEGSIGFMRLLRGAQGPGGKGGKLKRGGIDDATKDEAERKIVELERTFDDIARHFNESGDITKGFKDVSRLTESMGALSVTTTELAKKFGVLAGMTQAQIDKALGPSAAATAVVDAAKAIAGAKDAVQPVVTETPRPELPLGNGGTAPKIIWNP